MCKNDIRTRSRALAPDVDGWISSAKQVKADIQGSKNEAREIVQQGDQGRQLRADVLDSDNQAQLLEKELVFNQDLESSLRRLQAIHGRLDQIQRAILDDKLLEAADALTPAQEDIRTLASSNNVRVFEAFSSNVADLRNELVTRLDERWQNHVFLDKQRSAVTIKSKEDGKLPLNMRIFLTEVGYNALDVESITTAMRRIGTFENTVSSLSKNIELLLLRPRMLVQADGSIRSISISGRTIASSEEDHDLSAESLFSDIIALIKFFCQELPLSMTKPLSQILMPALLSPLVSLWLMSAVPEHLDGMEDFQHTVSFVKDFGSRLDALQWPGKKELDQWTANVPNTWLRKRQETVLNNVRKLLSRGISSTETVERKETHIISNKDEILAVNAKNDDWNTRWSDDDEESKENAPISPQNDQTNKSDDEDVSAWGFEDAKEDQAELPQSPNSPEDVLEDDGAADWGWGAEDDQSPVTEKKAEAEKANGVHRPKQQNDQQQITLTEVYTITSLPKELSDIISNVISDYTQLQSPSYARSPFRQCAPSLASLPALALALFRASSPIAYDAHPSSNMLLYNDCLWLAEHLDSLYHNVPEKQGSNKQELNIKVLTTTLQSHGRRSYSKEMDSQRTIITDLLDGAQGFANCTVHPFNQECDLAVDSTIKRLRHLHQEWKSVLSHSALVQAIGSLLSTVCSKMILDIEDLSDISEPQSQQLKRYFTQIASLEDIFTPEAPEGSSPEDGSSVPVTAAYVPSWFRFQYLGLILDGSMSDILDLWNEQDLSLEFKVEELIDLVKALFEDGPRRRSAILEIRQIRR